MPASKVLGVSYADQRPGHRAETIDNELSISAADTAEIVLGDIRVPAANIAGKRNRGVSAS